MRVGLIALQHESNTFHSTTTSLEDFRRVALFTGESIRSAYADSHHEIAGFFEGLSKADITAVPLLTAAAVPGGIVTDHAVEQLLRMMQLELHRAAPLDGLLVAPHGAAVSRSERDLDGFWLSRLREEVGPELPMICTLDPHANVSPRMIAACQATIAYRTNPHLDQRQTGLIASKIMARTLRGEIIPTQSLAMPPVAISIDRQHTSDEPVMGIYNLADKMLKSTDVLSNSVILGFPYADVAEVGSSFLVTTDNQPELAKQLADELSDYLIRHRHDFVCGLTDIDEAIAEAVSSAGRVCLLDVGDNVGGGSPGDGTRILRTLDQNGISNALICLFDPISVEKASSAGVGNKATLTLGGRGDELQGPPLECEVTVHSLHRGSFHENEPRHGGRVDYDMGPTAIVQTSRGITVMLISQRVPPFSLKQWTSCGIDPQLYKIIVAKGVNAPIAAYREVCDKFIRVNTPGVTCADMTQQEFRFRRRPLFPFEEIL